VKVPGGGGGGGCVFRGWGNQSQKKKTGWARGTVKNVSDPQGGRNHVTSLRTTQMGKSNITKVRGRRNVQTVGTRKRKQQRREEKIEEKNQRVVSATKESI